MVVYFIFAVIGRWMFGGLIYDTNPVLKGSEYAQAEFFSLNFNDLGGSFVTLFALMIVNNWYIVANGFLVSSNSIWVSAYFVAFFVVCNLVVLNILVSLVIEVATTWKETGPDHHGPKHHHDGPHGFGDKMSDFIMGREKPEQMLCQVLEKEEELYAKSLLPKPTHAQ